MKVLESWLRGYRPEELFDEHGRLVPELKALAPTGTRRMSANPIANGGLLRRPLDMPDFRDCAVKVEKPGATLAGNVPTLGNFLREVTRLNMPNFRVFGPDETQSNRLEALYDAMCQGIDVINMPQNHSHSCQHASRFERSVLPVMLGHSA